MDAGSERCLDIDVQLQPFAARARKFSPRHDDWVHPKPSERGNMEEEKEDHEGTEELTRLAEERPLRHLP